jgi:hypothetical protein
MFKKETIFSIFFIILTFIMLSRKDVFATATKSDLFLTILSLLVSFFMTIESIIELRKFRSNKIKDNITSIIYLLCSMCFFVVGFISLIRFYT